jgi:hypothetical protein
MLTMESEIDNSFGEAVNRNISVTCSGANEGGLQRKRVRRDGWTDKRREDFLAALAETSNVSAAVAKVGMTVRGLYALRHREPGFAACFQTALEEGYARLELEMLERARFGIGTEAEARRYNDAIALKLLSRHDAIVAKTRALRSDPAMAAIDHDQIQRDLIARIDMLRERREATRGDWLNQNGAIDVNRD